MRFPNDEHELDDALAGAFEAPSEANFDAWRRKHADAVAQLNPERLTALVQRRHMMIRTITIGAAAAVFAFVFFGLPEFGGPNREGAVRASELIEQIEKAKTVTWKTTFYSRSTSGDGKRQWIEAETRSFAYKAPGLYRDAGFDENGQISWLSIEDRVNLKQLTVNVKKKQARIVELSKYQRQSSGPFEWVNEQIKKQNLELIGSRETANGEVNVCRYQFRDESNDRDWSYDFLVDAETKQLVGFQVPGADIYDPEGDPLRENPREEGANAHEALSYIQHDIQVGVELDDSLFGLEPPEGYAVENVGRPEVTEEEMVEYLEVLADYNGRVFPDYVIPYPFAGREIGNIPEEERTAAEQRLWDKEHEYIMAGMNAFPVLQFMDNHAEANSFRYVGKGVRLGDADRMVCWYRLTGAAMYRVVYGDLSIKEVWADDLPLSVER